MEQKWNKINHFILVLNPSSLYLSQALGISQSLLDSSLSFFSGPHLVYSPSTFSCKSPVIFIFSMSSRRSMDRGTGGSPLENFAGFHRQPSNFSPDGASQEQNTPGFEAANVEPAQPLRLPQIRLPPFDANFNRHQNQSRLSTCPSLHQHPPGRETSTSTQTMLRKFFARPDDSSDYVGSHAHTSSSTERLSVAVPSCFNQPPTLARHFRQSSVSHSQPSSDSNLDHMRSHERRSSVFEQAARTYSPIGAGSTRANEFTPDEEGYWENSPQPGSSMNPHSGLLENSTSANNFEDAGTEHGELYRCRDCNRKCKSKASYLKHRSMMCTHRLGPLTLECRYCKRHYTYAGYLQRHEIECAKAHNA